MGRRSQAKGSRFENLIARTITDALSEAWAMRNLHQDGGRDTGRDLWLNLPFCIQCIFAKVVNVWKKLKEAADSARPGEMPVLISKKDYKPIIVSMYLDDWLELVKRALPWVGQ